MVGSPGGSLSRLSHTKVCATVAGSNSLGHQANLETARLWTKTYRKKSGEVFFPTRSQSPRVSLDEYESRPQTHSFFAQRCVQKLRSTGQQVAKAQTRDRSPWDAVRCWRWSGAEGSADRTRPALPSDAPRSQ